MPILDMALIEIYELETKNFNFPYLFGGSGSTEKNSQS